MCWKKFFKGVISACVFVFNVIINVLIVQMFDVFGVVVSIAICDDVCGKGTIGKLKTMD